MKVEEVSEEEKLRYIEKEIQSVKQEMKRKKQPKREAKKNEEGNNRRKKQKIISTNTSENIDKKSQVKPKRNIFRKVFLVFVILVVIGLSTVAFLLYGPYPGFREWLITTAMTTMNHQYLATWFYSQETINEVMSRNTVVEVDETTDSDQIEFAEEKQEVIYENEYERAILEKEPCNDLYKVIDIQGKGYTGYLVAVYDPSKIKTVVTKNLGTAGQYLTKMASDNNAIVAINGGGFDDVGHVGTGGTPSGITISNGKAVITRQYAATGGVIGFDKNNVLVLGKMTAKEALAKGIRDAVSFGPFLIVNGKPSIVKGNGGWGSAPRTAIGQRKDGIVLFLVIDGRMANRQGASMVDLLEIMQNYGAYNASNLDGGTSSVLYVNGKIINDPIDSSGAHKTRPIATGFIVTK